MSDQNVTISIALKGAAAVKSGIKEVADGAAKALGSITALGAVLAGAAGLGSLVGAAVATAKLGGQLSDLKNRTGASTDFLIKFRQALADTGSSADSAGEVLNRMQRAIYEAASNGGPASDALQSIGLQAENLLQLRPDDQFVAIQNAITAIQDPAQRTAAAMAIFGKSAGEIVPLLTDGGAMDNASKTLGRMPEILGRNVQILDDISDAFDRLPNKATQLFAGIFDQIGPTVKAILDAFESIDLTALGQKIGAYVNVGIQMWKDGKLAEFITLSLGAAWELGMQKGKEWLDWLTTTQSANAIGNFAVTLVAGVAKAFIDIAQFFDGVWYGMMIYAGATLVDMLKAGVNFFAAGLESVVNATISAVKALSPTLGQLLPGGVALPRASGTGVDFENALGAGMAIANAKGEELKGTVDKLVGTYREFFGIAQDGAAAPISNLEQLNALIAEQLDLTEKRNAEFYGPPAPPANIVAPMNIKLALQRLELQYAQELNRIRESTGQVEANWLLTNNQKYEQKKALLKQQLDLINAQVQALEALKTSANDSERLQIDQKITGLQGQAGGVSNQMLGMGADPNSFSEQFNQTLVNLQNNFQTAAQMMASTFASVFNAAFSSISSGIEGLIMGTKTWGQALLGIGQSVVQSLVKAFSDMVAQWIMSHIIMKGVSMAWAAFQSAMRTKDVIQANATEAAKMPALAVNATLASIGSWGVAAIIGVAAIAGILAGMGAFRDGGYTGDGDPNAPAGIVHRGEFVVPAEAVDRIGVSSLEAMVSGGPSVPAATSSAAPSPIALNLGYFDDPRRMADWARSQDGRTVLIDIVRQQAHEFSRA